jgi:plastocyanin
MKLKTIFSVVTPLSLEDSGFTPARIEAPAGTRVRVDVTNRSTSAIEFESHDLDRERVVQPGRTVAIYVSDLQPGRYEFFDAFHPEHRGALVVAK